jgi:hypothetical protein
VTTPIVTFAQLLRLVTSILWWSMWILIAAAVIERFHSPQQVLFKRASLIAVISCTVAYYTRLVLFFRSAAVRQSVPRSKAERMIDDRWGINDYFPNDANERSQG